MPILSMTGFGRADGDADGSRFTWEIRAVNGKGLDLRVRMPAGFEAIEPEVRRLVAARVTRGNLQATLAIARGEDGAGRLQVNTALLAEILRLSADLVDRGQAAPPTADGLLGLRGVLEAPGPAAGEAGAGEVRAVLSGLGAALDALVGARAEEGAQLAAALTERLARIEALTAEADRDPGRSPAAIRERLRRQIAELTGTGAEALDEGRLLAEVAIIATRADIGEEIDRLRAHVVACRDLLRTGGAVGRRLDFLSQEFNRESNTLCAKSNATSLTAVGVELKIAADQFREQVQNVE